MGRCAVVLAISAVVAAVVTVAPSAAATTVAPPGSMASLGDSITRAADVCCWYGDHAGESWSTGGAWWDGVRSQYERLVRLDPALRGNAHNDAASGARVSALAGQAAAVSQRVRYVTVLIGANDVCTSSPSTMTSVTDFRTRFAAGLSTLERGLPHAHVFVASIPNIYRLWQVLHGSWLARFVWSTAHICPSMLSSSNTDTTRQRVLARERAFNRTMASACAAHANCRWDRYATYGYPFGSSQVSRLDYFHPNLSGQAALASVTWSASWWG